MCINFCVRHISAKNSGVADYLSHLLSLTNEAPEYPRLLRSYRPAAGFVKVLSDEEENNYDYELLNMAHQASEDREYGALIQAVKIRICRLKDLFFINWE